MLKATSDRKTRFYNNQYNTYGLTPGKEHSCPGATEGYGGCLWKAPGHRTCSCYVDSLMRCYNGISGVLRSNFEALQKARSVEKMTEILDAEFTRFEEAEIRRSEKAGEALYKNMFYRIHWSGDVFNKTYARALRNAMCLHPNVHFWTYTRSFSVVPILLETPNLILYLSLDPVNIIQGMKTYAKYRHAGHLQLCYMSVDNDFELWKPRIRKAIGNSQWIAPIKLRPCPVDEKKLPMENGCMTCRRCLTVGTAPVWFRTK